ncbi:MAG: formylglycine-generating enzyme family protein, partial [Pyrinomonadaceae bacterium]
GVIRRKQEEQRRAAEQRSGAHVAREEPAPEQLAAGFATMHQHVAQDTIGPHSARRVAAPGVTVAAPAKSRSTVFALAAVLILALVGGGALVYFLANNGSREPVNNADPKRGNTNANPSPSPARVPTRPDLVELPGGTFQMGLKDVPPRTSDHSVTHLQWVYTQWPARAVTVASFAIDRTEVTNAEYAEFVSATAYPPPPAIWDGNQPRAGQEQWPVRNVTFEDAQRFAIWRSRRDGVLYRLPTEEEWEYAARGGTPQLYPWGGEWSDGRANLENEAPKPVGSFPEGATPQGLQDMIGNVWEWTSTEASMYRGNDLMKLSPQDQGKAVVRGGSYQSSPRGDKLITATTRSWEPKDKRDPVIGFRLVRPGS